jgi:hypothetical protein
VLRWLFFTRSGTNVSDMRRAEPSAYHSLAPLVRELSLLNMGKVARFACLCVTLAAACDDAEGMRFCEDRATEVSVNERLDALEGETAAERFERAAAPRDCTVSWLEVPAQVGTSEPPPGSSALDLVLERTSDTGRYRAYGQSLEEKYEALTCQPSSVFVPCSLSLRSEDGGLDELLDCELRLQGANTLLNIALGAYDFAGSHAVSFAGDVPADVVELYLVYTPGVDPTRVDGGIAESASLPGPDPFLTTAAIACPAL